LYGSRIRSFLEELGDEEREKLEWTLELVRELDRIPVKYFKSLEGAEGLYEIRMEWIKLAFRIFCFFDEGNVIVLIHGIVKKKQKTPIKEIKIAKELMRAYHEEKKQ